MENFALNALRAAAAAAMLAAPAALMATPLVVRSAGPSAKAYPPGRPVGENTPVVLKAGDVVTVLAPSGARTLRGPGTFKVAGGGGAPAFNARSRFSAMRGPEVPPSPGLWDVDVSRSGNVCLADPAQVILWRPAAAAEATLQVIPAAGAGQPVAWPAGRLVQRWPQQLPIADGSEYSLRWADSAEPTRLRFKTLAAVGDDPTALAKALIDNGCQAQLDLLIKAAPEE
ncbi:MAG TPA: hypothetical protein VFQ67_06905 [Allosphingosinicella sp.]|jgi:hypothetical protein|nr:hypothetical protein [Allosphingosinicella sp.]